MPVETVLLLGNPILREKSINVEELNHIKTQQIITNLSDTLTYFQTQEGLGRGLAAPQIGVLEKIIVYKTPGAPEVMINPNILKMSTKKIMVWDSCFCFNLAFFIKVERFREVKVEYQNRTGKKEVIYAKNDLAELFQHEIDHLNGILATDRLISLQDIMTREEWDRQLRRR